MFIVVLIYRFVDEFWGKDSMMECQKLALGAVFLIEFLGGCKPEACNTWTGAFHMGRGRDKVTARGTGRFNSTA